MGKYFGTDGYRGYAGKELLSVNAYKIGRFLGYYLLKEGKRPQALIGKDTRLSCGIFEGAIASGLASSGADVYILGVSTTPSVSILTRDGGFDVGIMISASHNPYHDNGIKILNARGEKIDDYLISEIENYIDNEEKELPWAQGSDIGKIENYDTGLSKYIDFIASACNFTLEGLKIGLDPGNGGGFKLCQEIFARLGAEVHAINIEPNGININEGCGSTHIEALSKYVKENGLNVGFAYDGDADRCIAVDENGDIVDGDKIMYALAIDLKDMGKLKGNKIVSTVMSNGGLYRALSNVGIGYIETKVGDRYVSEEMIRNGFSLGGEQSGHIILSEYASTGDGILTSVKLAELISKKKCMLSKLVKAVKPFPQILKNVHVSDKNAVLSSNLVKSAKDRAEKALKESGGRILLRPSGTEPLVRIMVEGENEWECEKIACELENAIILAEKEVTRK